MSSIAWQIVFSILAADFFTGLVHWWEQTYGLPTWPVLGKHVIEPNIDHHRHPTKLGEGTTFWHRNYQSMALAAAVSAVLYLFGTLTWQLGFTAALASLGNEIHTLAHRKPSRLVKFLHDAAILQTPAHHARHHRPPYDKSFCTITNITNHLLDATKFWRGVEAVVGLCGIQPKRMTEARDFL